METLRVRGPYSKKLFYGDKGRSFLCVRNVLGRAEIRLLRPQLKHANHIFSLSISLPHKIIQPIFLLSSLSSSHNQVDVENEELELKETQIKDTNQAEIAHVKFQLRRECSFGQQFLLVGDDPIFGLWNPENAIPLNWSDGHVWTVELYIPIGKSIKFKFIMKGGTEDIFWQPGPDRILETWETEKTITICEDWDNAHFQKIIEEEPTSNQIEGYTENLAEPIVAEDSTTTDGYRDADIPKAFVAAKEKSEVNTNNTQKKDPIAVSNKDIETGGYILGNNGRAVNAKDFSSTKDEGNLVSYEGVPVLVPGLTPLPTSHKDEESVDEALITSIESDKAKHLKLPELYLKKEQDNNSPRLKERSEMLSGNNRGEPRQKEQPQIAKEHYQHNTHSFDNMVDNDIQWGRKTLQKLLNSLGIR